MADIQQQPIAPFQGATNGHHHRHQKHGSSNRSNPKMSDPDPPFLTTTSLVQLSVTYTSLIQQYLNLHCTDNATFLAERYFACTNAPNVVDHNDGDGGGDGGGNTSTRMKRAHALYLVAFCYYRQRKLDPCRYLLLQHDSLWNDIRCSSSSSKNKKSTKKCEEEETEGYHHHQEEEQEDNEMEHLSSDIRYLFSTVCYELGYNEEAIQTLLGGISEAEPSSTKRKSSSSSSSDANARQRPHVAELMGHALVTRSSSSSSSSSKHKDPSKKDSTAGDIKLSTGLLNEIPKGAAGLQLLGHLCRVTSRPHIAKECYRQALKQDPCLFTSFMALAELCNHDTSSNTENSTTTTTSSAANVEEETSKSSSMDPIIDVESIFGVPLPEVIPPQIADDNVMSQQEVPDGAGATTTNAALAFPLRYGGLGGNQVTAQFYSGGVGASTSDTPTSGTAAISAAAKETPVPASSHMNTTGATPLLARASLHDQPLFKNDHPQQQHQKNNNQYYNQNLTLNLSSLSVKTPYNSSYSMFGAPPPSSTFAGGGGVGAVAIGSAPRLSMASSKGRGPTALFASPDMTPIPKADASTRMQTPTKGGVTSMMGGPSFDVTATNSFMMGAGAGGGGGTTDGGAAAAADMSMNSTTVAAHQHLPMQTPTSAFLKGPPQITRAIETASAVAARLYYHPSPESKPPLSGRRVRFSSIGSAGGTGGGDYHGGGGDYPTRKGGAYYYHRRDSYDDHNNYDDHSSFGGRQQQQPYDTHTTTNDDTMDADVTMGDASLLNNTNTKSNKLRAASDSAPSSPLIGKRSNSSRVGSAKRLFRTASFSKKEKSSGRTTAVDVDYHSETKEEGRPSGSTSYHPSGIVAMGTSGLKRRGSSSKDHAVAQQHLPRQESSSGMYHDAPNNEEGVIVEEVTGGVVVDASEGIVPVLTLLATLGQGYLHLCRYECEEALEVFRNQLSSEQYYTGWVLHQIGKAYFEMLNFHQTKRILEHMHYLEPHRIQGLEVLSTTLWHLKDEIALSSLSQKVTELDPTSPECWCVVGNTFSLQKDHDTALSFFQRAIQVNPRFTYAHTLCGHEYRENEDLDQALKCYRHAIQLDPRHYNAWYGLASIFARQEKYEFAEYHYQRAIQIHPRSAVLLYHLATVQNARGLSTQALTTLDKVYQINPNYDQARFLRANIYMSDGRHEAALQELIHVRNNMPMESSVYFSMGKMYKALGRKSDALNCFVTALDLDPKNDNNLIKSAMDRIDEEDIEEDISTF